MFVKFHFFNFLRPNHIFHFLCFHASLFSFNCCANPDFSIAIVLVPLSVSGFRREETLVGS